ncbi:hypothetical protein Sfulv_26370 [Streptomyces fulvorobeus]|uniref:Uncharacterized protein n=1 Tax=Streptomyces fulvorobeus TaxID=284028 RepID=A0A7J0C7V3_9ACTN|nr:hypothetical protein Sfulv_26370 [Streptomyces fulvorobeus]
MAGRVAEDVEGAGDLGLGADDGAHERALSAAGGAEEAGDPAGFDGEAEAAQDGAVASYDGEGAGFDGGGWFPGWFSAVPCIIHHVMNFAAAPA